MGIRDESGGRMKPQDYSVYELMSPRQYRIPVYQRPYSWAEKQVKSLLDDITKNYNKHIKDENIADLYIGNFIVSQVKDPSKELIYDVVDGQQRLVTLTLITCALYCLSQKYQLATMFNDNIDLAMSAMSCIKKMKDSLWRKKGDIYDKNDRIVEPGQIEKPAFDAVLDYAFSLFHLVAGGNKAYAEPDIKKIYPTENISPIELRVLNNFKTAYDYYSSMFEQSRRNLRPFIDHFFDHVYCVFYSASADVEGGTAFEIFESINSKGKKLDEIDLIKTRIFSCIPKEEADDYLKILGELIVKTQDGLAGYLATYLRAYIVYSRSAISLDSFTNITGKLESFFSTSDLGTAYKVLLLDLESKIDYYLALFDEEKANKYLSTQRFRFFFKAYFLEYNFEYPRPLIFRAFNELDKKAKPLPKTDAESVIVASISEMVAFLTISKRGSRDIISTFQDAMTRIIGRGKDVNINKDEVLYLFGNALTKLQIDVDSLTKGLSGMDCWGEEKSFGYSLLSLVSTSYGEKNIYWDGALARFNECGTNYTLDHLMPKTPLPNDKRIKYANVGGNLTLREGHDFNAPNIKEGMKFDDFRKQVLNVPGNLALKSRSSNAEKNNRVLDDNIKNYTSLKERSNQIADFYVNKILALDKPSASYQPPKTKVSVWVEDIIDFTMESRDDLTKTKPSAISVDTKAYEATSYYNVLVDIVDYLYSIKADELKELAKKKFYRNNNLKSVVYITDNPDDLEHKYSPEGSNIYFQTNRSANAMYEEIHQILVALGEDTSKYYLTFCRKEEN